MIYANATDCYTNKAKAIKIDTFLWQLGTGYADRRTGGRTDREIHLYLLRFFNWISYVTEGISNLNSSQLVSHWCLPAVPPLDVLFLVASPRLAANGNGRIQPPGTWARRDKPLDLPDCLSSRSAQVAVVTAASDPAWLPARLSASLSG